MRRRCVTMIAIVCASAVVAAQEMRPAFAVASIRPAERPVRLGGPRILPGGRFEARRTTVVDLLYFAYGLTFIYAPRVVGGPEWITTARYEIVAVPEGNPERAAPGALGPVHYMVQRLLAERFNLAFHWETRHHDGFALVLAHSDGRFGPGLRRSDLDCEALVARYRASDSDDERALLQQDMDWCSDGGTIEGATKLRGLRLSAFATHLNLVLSAPVVDETGLEGTYDIEMKAAPVLPPEQLAALTAAGEVTFGIPLEEAIIEQLGLKLQRKEVPVDVIVVDRLDRPTEN